MKTLIVLAFVIGLSTGVFAKNKDVVYVKDTKEIIAVKDSNTPIKTAKDKTRVDIVCENGTKICGATDKISIIAVDDKAIPADITPYKYKIDTDKKEIYQEIILEEQP